MTTPTSTLPAPLLLSLLPTIGASRYWALIDAFGSAEQALAASPELLKGLNIQAKQAVTEYQKNGINSALAQKAQAIIETVHQCDGKIISCESPLYPDLLLHIHRPPPVLYIKGSIDNLQLPQIALVGSRHATHQGLQNTQRFSAYLARHELAITSGLALGIDREAHQGALSVNGKTIAVMATGIDQVYPRHHLQLAEDIVAQGGTLVTEFMPFSSPKAAHFPQRNRIISGLSMGVLVVEGTLKSGSLITAKYALEQGREVFAIPGSIHNPQSKGCHQLIKQGAALVETADDIIEHLGGFLASLPQRQAIDYADKPLKKPLEPKTHQPQQTLDDHESIIINHLGYEPISIDQLIELTQLSNQELTTALLNLQIKGWVTRSDWGYERV